MQADEIRAVLERIDPLPAIEAGFAAYSEGRAVVPPVGEMLLERGEVHIKSGYIRDDADYVIKIASGFYGNAEHGLPTSGGCMLLFSQETGQVRGVLLDEGHLTDVRTAVAGAVVAKHLAPRAVERIGIVGAGIQARTQLQYLARVVHCRDVLVWDRLEGYLEEFGQWFATGGPGCSAGYRLETAIDIEAVQSTCNLIVTTTPAQTPLLRTDLLRPGTHVTAVGSDTPEKQELESDMLAAADLVVADSLSQCRVRGEISHALRGGHIIEDQVTELGRIVAGKAPGRTTDSQTTIADLTGVAVQDLQIATAVLTAADKC